LPKKNYFFPSRYQFFFRTKNNILFQKIGFSQEKNSIFKRNYYLFTQRISFLLKQTYKISLIFFNKVLFFLGKAACSEKNNTIIPSIKLAFLSNNFFAPKSWILKKQMQFFLRTKKHRSETAKQNSISKKIFLHWKIIFSENMFFGTNIHIYFRQKYHFCCTKK